MRLPSGTPVSPAMNTPPKNQADYGAAENRLPRASATLMLVVSGDSATMAVRAVSTGVRPPRGRRSPPAGGCSVHGSPGRGSLFAARASINPRRAAA